jgi:hypothetical protein
LEGMVSIVLAKAVVVLKNWAFEIVSMLRFGEKEFHVEYVKPCFIDLYSILIWNKLDKLKKNPND